MSSDGPYYHHSVGGTAPGRDRVLSEDRINDLDSVGEQTKAHLRGDVDGFPQHDYRYSQGYSQQMHTPPPARYTSGSHRRRAGAPSYNWLNIDICHTMLLVVIVALLIPVYLRTHAYLSGPKPFVPYLHSGEYGHTEIPPPAAGRPYTHSRPMLVGSEGGSLASPRRQQTARSDIHAATAAASLAVTGSHSAATGDIPQQASAGNSALHDDHQRLYSEIAAVRRELAALTTHKVSLPLVTPWKSQNFRGTCWDFATTALLEWTYRSQGVQQRWLRPEEYVFFSEQAYGIAVLNQCAKFKGASSACLIGGDAVWKESTEGGEIELLYYLGHLHDKVMPHAVCPYPVLIKPTAHDRWCPGLTAALTSNPLHFRVKSARTLYDLDSIKRHLRENRRPLGFSTPMTTVSYFYPCGTGHSFPSVRLACKRAAAAAMAARPLSEQKALKAQGLEAPCQTTCPVDMNVPAGTCCVRVVRPDFNLEGEFYSHGISDKIEGGHAMVIVGYNDQYESTAGDVGGFVLKNWWHDGIHPLNGPVVPRGSHSQAYLMQEISRVEEAQICPNSYNLRNWYQCGAGASVTRAHGSSGSLAQGSLVAQFASADGVTSEDLNAFKECISPETNMYARVARQPLNLICVAGNHCQVGPRFRYFLHSIQAADDDMVTVCLWEYELPERVTEAAFGRHMFNKTQADASEGTQTQSSGPSGGIWREGLGGLDRRSGQPWIPITPPGEGVSLAGIRGRYRDLGTLGWVGENPWEWYANLDQLQTASREAVRAMRTQKDHSQPGEGARFQHLEETFLRQEHAAEGGDGDVWAHLPDSWRRPNRPPYLDPARKMENAAAADVLHEHEVFGVPQLDNDHPSYHHFNPQAYSESDWDRAKSYADDFQKYLAGDERLESKSGHDGDGVGSSDHRGHSFAHMGPWVRVSPQRDAEFAPRQPHFVMDDKHGYTSTRGASGAKQAYEEWLERSFRQETKRRQAITEDILRQESKWMSPPPAGGKVRKVCLPPMVADQIPYIVQPIPGEVLPNDPDRCGFYFFPYSLIRTWWTRFRDGWASDIDIQWEPESYVRAPAGKTAGVSYDRVIESTGVQRSYAFFGPFPYMPEGLDDVQESVVVA